MEGHCTACGTATTTVSTRHLEYVCSKQCLSHLTWSLGNAIPSHRVIKKEDRGEYRNGVLYLNNRLVQTEVVEVRKSSEDKGNGLFARKKINKGDAIVKYGGPVYSEEKKRVMSDEELSYAVEMHDPFAEGKEKDKVLLPFPYVDSPANAPITRIAGFANHATGTEANATTDRDYDDNDKMYMYLRAKRTILKGEEILWDYGPAYWKDKDVIPK